MNDPMGNSIFLTALFRAKTIAFLAAFCILATFTAQAQTDTVYQKPSLNNGMPPAEVTPPVIIVEPARQKPAADTVVKVKVKEKEDYKEPVAFKDRFFTGGGFGLSFGDFTNINVAPILGYRINNWVSVGTGLSYFYVNEPGFEGSLLGGKLFTQAMVYKNFFAHGEYELVDFRSTFTVVLAGAGYRQMFSDRVGMDLMILFDLNVNGTSFYQNPVIRPSLIINL